ncbi:MAG: DNA mismatch repair protein MutS [Oligoflexia bacterium]|nr:DNA mismatch repair protein MutS [Oligoflexia bacterium]
MQQEHQYVSELVSAFEKRELIRSQLSLIGDLERKVVKLSNPLCNSRDLFSLGKALELALPIIPEHHQNLAALSLEILGTFVDELPHSVKEGGMIRPGINATLDEYIDLTTNVQNKLSELEAMERARSGIQSLKVKYNGVFGYSFEITKANLDKVPKHFIRKQTLAQAERFVTEELSDLETKILSAQSRRCDLEFEIFQSLKKKALHLAQDLLRVCEEIAVLDLRASFAELAVTKQYVRPNLGEPGTDLELVGSRHPVIELLTHDAFVPNDIYLKPGHCILLTGPNMAGKSTLMRQVVLSTLLNQIGSFVPAKSARLPLMNQIHTRIGASDHLSRGLSTFMVEMTETAEILKAAGPDSIVILDEIGRGTSTYDGLSLAQAILEFFVDRVKPYLFFATHYHELTELSQSRPSIENFHMSIDEHQGSLVFLRRMRPGPANRSYGIEVAKQAGLPTSLTKRAQEILKDFAKQELTQIQKQLSLLSDASPSAAREEMEQSTTSLIEDIRKLNLNELTPLQALNALSELQKQALEEVKH